MFCFWWGRTGHCDWVRILLRSKAHIRTFSPLHHVFTATWQEPILFITSVSPVLNKSHPLQSRCSKAGITVCCSTSQMEVLSSGKITLKGAQWPPLDPVAWIQVKQLSSSRQTFPSLGSFSCRRTSHISCIPITCTLELALPFEATKNNSPYPFSTWQYPSQG